MGQSAEELRAEIERTRTELSTDLDAIGDRVSPRRMVERRTNRAKNFVGDTRTRVFGRADDVKTSMSDRSTSAVDTLRSAPDSAAGRVEGNPMIAGAVAFGVGFLAAVVFPGSQTEAEAVQRVGDAAQPLKEQAVEAAKEVASSTKEAGQQAVEELKGSAQERAADVKDTAQQERSNLPGQS